MDLSSVTPSPAGLRALSHPVRLRILGTLRVDGPSTASQLATRFGLNSGATSYHLRQLAHHGFVEEDTERGDGRDRWWRAVHQSTVSRSRDFRTDEEHQTQDAFLQAAVTVYAQTLQAAVEDRPLLPQEWREASTFSDWGIRLPAHRARELCQALKDLVESWDDEPGDDPAHVQVLISAFPRPGEVAGR